MKRTVPMLITGISGFVLLISFFIPYTEGWGEKAAIWFDILAAIAFILGGGNLLKIHFKKISNRAAGWGFSLVTVLAFVATLTIGLGKVGSNPAQQQQMYGLALAQLELSDLPKSQTFSVEGQIPAHANKTALPFMVRDQLTQDGQNITFRGWIQPGQVVTLSGFQDELEWLATVEALAKAAQPPETLRGKVGYDAENSLLTYQGPMSDADHAALKALDSNNATWTTAVESLFQQSRRSSTIDFSSLPAGFKIPGPLQDSLAVDRSKKQLTMTGPMSPGQRAALSNQFSPTSPLPEGPRREAFIAEIGKHGPPLNTSQLTTLNNLFDGGWSAQQLITTVSTAGEPKEVRKSARELLDEKTAAEQKGQVPDLKPTRTIGKTTRLNKAQEDLLRAFSENTAQPVGELVNQLGEAGTLSDPQISALTRFISQISTTGERNRTLCFALLANGPLSSGQRDFLLADVRTEFLWDRTAGALFVAAHQPRFPWSGEYREQGSPFWWLYEYAFKPLTATMFAMLAFYVASAAFRAFRAKNLEAILLLGTAFIILLGRTFAGVTLTSWLPDSIAGLKIDNLTVTIMTVFNTAGNRAIMIGIALGIAATSLKVLLGVDRSYLGSQED